MLVNPQREYKIDLDDGYSIVYFFEQYGFLHAKVDDKENYRRDVRVYLDTGEKRVEWRNANAKAAIRWVNRDGRSVKVDLLEDCFQRYLADLIVGAPARMWDRWNECWIDVPKDQLAGGEADA